MNPTLRPASIFFLVCAFAIALTGCATMRPISSPPPMAKVILTAPYTAHDGFATVILPAGEYRPLYEDDRFFYYQAPAKIVVNRFFSRMFDGGVYVKRDGSGLRGWYYIDEQGSQNFGRFETEPPHR